MTSPETTIQDLAAVTVTVPATDLDRVARRYADLLGYEVKWDGTLGDLAPSWGVADRRMLVLGAPGEQRGLVRLLAGDATSPPPLTTIGWSAMEITVADVDAMARRLMNEPDVRVNGQPHDLVVADAPPGQRAMQVVGPAGEQWYLTQILRQYDGGRLATPPDGQPAGAVFIAVLACGAHEAARAFYVGALGLNPYLEFDFPLSVAARENGWEDPTVRITALRPIGETRIELDRYPEGAARRSRLPGELPGGLGLVSFTVTRLEETIDRLSRAGHAPAARPVTHPSPPYHDSPAVVVTGGDGELVELIAERGR